MSNRAVKTALGAAILIAILVASDPAPAADGECSKLFKSNYLRERCNELGNRNVDRLKAIKMSCVILKFGQENPHYPRSSEDTTDLERSVQECINQYPDLGPLKPSPPSPKRSAAQPPPKPRYELGSVEEGIARAACEKAVAKLEVEGKLDRAFDGFDPEVRRAMRNGVITMCIAQDRFGTTGEETLTPETSAYSRGLAAFNEGDLDTAIAEFTTAIANDPKDPFPYIRRGTAYEKKGDATSAVGDYRKVLKLVDAETGAAYVARIRRLEKAKK